MIVVDSNIIGYLYLSSERSSQAEEALRKDSQWIAPLLWRSEFRNVLALYVRKRRLSLETAQQIMNEAADLMTGQEYEVVSSQVLNLAAKSGCTAYDCEFVSLAQELGIPLVTVDKQVLEQFPGVAVPLDEYAGGAISRRCDARPQPGRVSLSVPSGSATTIDAGTGDVRRVFDRFCQGVLG